MLVNERVLEGLPSLGLTVIATGGERVRRELANVEIDQEGREERELGSQDEEVNDRLCPKD